MHHYTEYNDILHNVIQHNNKNEAPSKTTLYAYAECRHAECRQTECRGAILNILIRKK